VAGGGVGGALEDVLTILFGSCGDEPGLDTRSRMDDTGLGLGSVGAVLRFFGCCLMGVVGRGDNGPVCSDSSWLSSSGGGSGKSQGRGTYD